MESEYDIIDDALDVANVAFGDDFENALKVVERYSMIAVACGCGRCIDEAIQIAREYANNYAIPNEDEQVTRYEIETYAPPADEWVDEDFDDDGYFYVNT